MQLQQWWCAIATHTDTRQEALALQVPAIINCHIDTAAQRKTQEFSWLTTDDAAASAGDKKSKKSNL